MIPIIQEIVQHIGYTITYSVTFQPLKPEAIFTFAPKSKQLGIRGYQTSYWQLADTFSEYEKEHWKSTRFKDCKKLKKIKAYALHRLIFV